MNKFESKLDRVMKRIWEESAKTRVHKTPDKQEMWLRLEQLMDIEETKTETAQHSQPVISTPILKPKLVWAFAAVVTLAIISPTLYQSLTTTTVVVERAQMKTVTLADGSTVKMNSDSEIYYRDGFGVDHRNVTLDGEAYFDVEKNTIPFIVHFTDASVEVLGTEFNIRSRNDVQDVSVLEGTVKVSEKIGENKIILNAGQMTQIYIDRPFKIKNIEFKTYPGWMYNKLILEQTKLKTVCNEIERKFNVKIDFASEAIADITVTGVIEADEFQPVMETLATLAQRSFKFEKDTYIIY